jgi:hydroxymethylbilane synthase
MRTLRLGTRGSLLAMAQSRGVAAALEAANPGLTVELVEIRTSGDRITDVPLLDGRVDLAVHSCKDLGTVLPEGLTLGAIPTREDPRDALVSTGPSLEALPPGARVGTSSQRRKNFLAHIRPDLDVRDHRGNVPTRVRAVDEGRMDAVVLALSGLRRLGLAERVVEALAPEVMLPAAAQGALALEIRSDDEAAAHVVQILDDPEACAEVTAERACLRRLEAGCQAPVGVLARWADGGLMIRAAAVTPDGATWAEHQGNDEDAEGTGVAVADSLLRKLGLTSLRDAPWAGKPPRAEPNEALREGTRAGETL